MGFKEELFSFPHAKIFFDYPLKKHSSFGVGGNAKYFASVKSLYGLKELLELCKRYKKKYKILGNGSNILFSDKGYSGIIISLKSISDIFFKKNEVKAMAGATLQKLLEFNLSNNLGGIECLTGIPATIGGAVVMNAGAFGKNISNYIVSVETLKKGRIVVYNNKECKFKYRQSRFKSKSEVIVSATFSFPKLSGEIIETSIKNYTSFRRAIQPNGRSCGSVFKNPKGFYAGELIDKAFLKGLRVGGAVVSNQHANFIIAEQNATASDIRSLICKIKEVIKNKFNILLEEEVEYVGDF